MSEYPYTWEDVGEGREPHTQAEKEKIALEWNKSHEYYTSIQYIKDREKSYISTGDQLDMLYWDQVNGTTIWRDAIAKVKADNPKS